MFDKDSSFRPGRNYAKDKSKYRIKYQGVNYDYSIFANLVIAEVILRGLVQRFEALQRKSETQGVLSPDDKSKLQEWEQELESLQAKLLLQEYTLYELEALLPAHPLKQMYDALRQDATWYLRPELVQDCIRRGGCCSRSCRCCQSRHLTTTRIMGIGHCTLECSCSEYRGSEPTQEAKTWIESRLKNMLCSSNPAFLLEMIEAYFSDPLRVKSQRER